MYLKRLYLIIISSVLVLLLGISIFEFVYFRVSTSDMKISYEQEVTALEKAVSDYGPMGKVWTVTGKTSPGHGVTIEDLKPMDMLSKNIGKNYITDPNKIIGKYFKLAIIPGTPLTQDLFMDEIINDTSRQFEVVASVIPVGLKVGDYIDYRFLLPKGEDYIVMNHKRVQGLYGKVITLYMTEEEIHTYQSLLIDYFINDGSQIYLTKYLEPSIQKPAQNYYPVSNNIVYLMSVDPNVTELIEESIIEKKRAVLDNSLKDVRNEIISKIASGRASTQSDLNSANNEFNERLKMEEEQKNANGKDSSGAVIVQSDEAGSVQNPNKPEQNKETDADADIPKAIAPKNNNNGSKAKDDSASQNKAADTTSKSTIEKKPAVSENKKDTNNNKKASDDKKMDGVVE
jgi:hypothetical protein